VVSVSVETPSDIVSPVDHVLRAEVAPLGHPGEVESVTLIQEILPRISGVYERYNSVPSVLKVAHVGSGRSSGAQLEFSGRGGLDEEGSRSIEFMLRGPGTTDDSVFGLREEYALRVTGVSHDVLLGDGPYEFSKLTGHRRQGRGARVGAEVGLLSLEGIYYRTRSWQPRADRSAARVGFGGWERLALGLSCMRTWRGDGDIVRRQVLLRADPCGTEVHGTVFERGPYDRFAESPSLTA
jgi:hypothetical protein